jgi:hypothetical protein
MQEQAEPLEEVFLLLVDIAVNHKSRTRETGHKGKNDVVLVAKTEWMVESFEESYQYVSLTEHVFTGLGVVESSN